MSLEGAYGDAAAGGASGAVNGNVALQFKLQGGKERFNIYRQKIIRYKKSKKVDWQCLLFVSKQ